MHNHPSYDATWSQWSSEPFLSIGMVWLPRVIEAVERRIWPDTAVVPTAGELKSFLEAQTRMRAAERLATMGRGVRSANSLNGVFAKPRSTDDATSSATDDERVLEQHRQRLLSRKVQRRRVCDFLRQVFEADRDWRVQVLAFSERGDLPIARQRWRDVSFFEWAVSRGRSNVSGEGPLFVRTTDFDRLMRQLSDPELAPLVPKSLVSALATFGNSSAVHGEQIAEVAPQAAKSDPGGLCHGEPSLLRPSDSTKGVATSHCNLTPKEARVVMAADKIWAERKLPGRLKPNEIYAELGRVLGDDLPDRKTVRTGMTKAGYNWPPRA